MAQSVIVTSIRNWNELLSELERLCMLFLYGDLCSIEDWGWDWGQCRWRSLHPPVERRAWSDGGQSREVNTLSTLEECSTWDDVKDVKTQKLYMCFVAALQSLQSGVCSTCGSQGASVSSSAQRECFCPTASCRWLWENIMVSCWCRVRRCACVCCREFPFCKFILHFQIR